jgi:hypothetical protein
MLFTDRQELRLALHTKMARCRLTRLTIVTLFAVIGPARGVG